MEAHWITLFYTVLVVSTQCSLVLGSSDRDVIGSDNVDQQFDVSVREILGRHLLSLLPLRLQRPFGLSQLEEVYSQQPVRHSKRPLRLSPQDTEGLTATGLFRAVHGRKRSPFQVWGKIITTDRIQSVQERIIWWEEQNANRVHQSGQTHQFTALDPEVFWNPLTSDNLTD